MHRAHLLSRELTRAHNLLKAVPASQEDLQLWAHSRCKRSLIGIAGAALVLSSDADGYQPARVMRGFLIDEFTFHYRVLLVSAPGVSP